MNVVDRSAIETKSEIHYCWIESEGEGIVLGQKLDGLRGGVSIAERSTTFCGLQSMLGELFDPQADVLVHERLRPHWSQAGAIVFVTFRTRDSIPKSVLDRWEREKKDWIQRRGTRRTDTGRKFSRS